MPTSAIKTGCVNYILEPAAIASRLDCLPEKSSAGARDSEVIWPRRLLMVNLDTPTPPHVPDAKGMVNRVSGIRRLTDEDIPCSMHGFGCGTLDVREAEGKNHLETPEMLL
jgi:hypothetical protein